MTDILLINPQPVVMKDLFAENLMYANPPLGLGYLASAARNAGYSVDLIDVGIDKLTISGILDRIIECDAKMVGISSFIANHGNGLRIAQEIKKRFGKEVIVMMGGPQASFVYEEVLKQGNVDIVSIFEGEKTIVELLNCIREGGDLKKVAGIAFVDENGEIVKTERRLPIQDLDTIAFPAWDLFKIDKYQEPGIVLTGRGCPYKCIFCSAGAIAGGRYRMRSVKNVVDEIEMLNKTYGIKKIFIADDTFTASEKHCIEICREIRNRNLNIAWQAEARANTVTDRVAAEMAKAGCHHVQIGAESGDNEILKKIGKNVTTDTIERAVRIFLRHGITVVCSFILGHPDDTMETCEKTIRFGKYLKTISGGYTSCKFAILTPLPGTPVYERKDDLGVKLLTKNWDNYTFFDTVMETKNLNKRQLQNLYMKAWATYAS